MIRLASTLTLLLPVALLGACGGSGQGAGETPTSGGPTSNAENVEIRIAAG